MHCVYSSAFFIKWSTVTGPFQYVLYLFQSTFNKVECSEKGFSMSIVSKNTFYKVEYSERGFCFVHFMYFRALFIKWSAVKGAFALCITQFVHTAREELNICHGKIICNSNIITNHPIDAAYFQTLWLAKCCKKWCAHIFISFHFFLFDFLLFKRLCK